MTGSLGAGAFAAGLVLLAVTLACALAAAALLVKKRFGYLDGVPRVLAVSLLGLVATIAAHLLPLTLGILSRPSVVVCALALFAAAWFLPGPAVAKPGGEAAQPAASAAGASGPISLAAAAIGVLVLAGYAIAYLEIRLASAVTSVDALALHLPGVIRFVQTGSLWDTTQYLPNQAQGNYPQYGDLLQLAVVLPWRSLAFVRYVDPVLLALAGLSVFAIGRELGAARATSALVACAAIAMHPALDTALNTVLTDPAFLAGFGIGTLFLLRQWRTGRRGELILAGVGLGLAFGTKWYGLTEVTALVVLWAVAGLITGRGRGRVAGDFGILAATIAAVGGIWMLRNLILTGNPIFNYKISLFGVTLFDAPPDEVRAKVGFTLAHYAGHLHVLREFAWPVFRADYWLAGAAVGLGAVASVVVWGARGAGPGASRRDPRIGLLAAGAFAIVAAYAVTPYSAQGLDGAPTLISANTRYAMPAMLAAAPLIAWAASRLSRRLTIAIDLALAVVVVLSARHQLPISGFRALGAGVAVAAVAAGVAITRAARPALASLLAVLAVAGAAGAFHFQRALATDLSWRNDVITGPVLKAPEHLRIGLTGIWSTAGLIPTAPLFGPRLHNTVEYVGPFIRHLRRQYSDRASFVEALRRGRYSFLVIGTGIPSRPHPHQEAWARSAGFRTVANSGRLLLMRAG